jgi:membrane dipeptidase
LSARASSLHQRLSIVDLHADTLLWGRNILGKSSIGHIDLPRLLEANVALQVFSVVTKTPRGLNLKINDDTTDNITLLALAQGWPWKSLMSLSERALYQARRLQEFSEQSDGRLVFIRNRGDLQKVLASRKNNHKVIGALLALEGAHALEGDPANLVKLYQAGYRMIGLTHFFDNEAGGSAHGIEKGGLTVFGRELIEQAEALHMVIDLSHASKKLISDVLEITTRPVVVSHTGVKGTCDRSRNLSDDQLRAIASGGGLIGIGFWPTATCGNGVEGITRALHYAKDIAGIEHIALGSDFDGAVSTPFDVTGLPLLTDALIREGYSDAEIHRVMGGNAINFLMQLL